MTPAGIWAISIFAVIGMATVAALVWICCALLLRWRYARHIETLRIKNRNLDRAYSDGQFSVPYGQRDFK